MQAKSLRQGSPPSGILQKSKSKLLVTQRLAGPFQGAERAAPLEGIRKGYHCLPCPLPVNQLFSPPGLFPAGGIAGCLSQKLPRPFAGQILLRLFFTVQILQNNIFPGFFFFFWFFQGGLNPKGNKTKNPRRKFSFPLGIFSPSYSRLVISVFEVSPPEWYFSSALQWSWGLRRQAQE